MAATLEKTNNSINKSLLQKNVYHDITLQDLFQQVQQNISAWNSMATRKDFLQMKLNLGSEALRESGVQHIGFKIQIPSTVFGELYEVFHWSFDIEGHSDIGNLQEQIYNKASLVKQREELSVESYAVRMHSLLGLQAEIKMVFDLIDKQLNYKNSEKALLLTSLVFYDLESLSIHRKSDYLLVDQMYNLDNPNDSWLACMSIYAQYLKPSPHFMSQVMH